MDIPRDRRDGDYDVKLVSCDDHGKIVDNNHVMLTVKTSAIMWGVILAVVLIIFGLASIFGPSTFLSVLIMVTAVGILITIFYSLYNCLTKLISKRDLNFKVYSLFELLPLVLVILVIQALFGLEVLVGSAVMLLFIGFIGAIFLIILKILF